MALPRALREHFRSYRPALESVIFGLSLLGVLDVIHLSIQQSQKFEQGCFGFSTLQAADSAFNCAAVTSGPSSQLFGVSNTFWGLAFYLAVAILTGLLLWGRPLLRGWVQATRTSVLTGGWLYSLYLVYLQIGPIGALCALCLVSAVIVTLLFGTQIAVFATSPSSTETPMPARLLKRQVTIFASLVAFAVLLIGADVTYFNGVGGADSEARQSAATAASSSSPAACEIDSSKEPVGNKGASLVGFQDITKGSAESGVTVIEYFDPNCPHCKHFHGTMKKLVKSYKDEVRFVFKPFPLRASSLPEIQALYVAAQSGKFTEMLEAQYARQSRTGINRNDLRAIASEIGMESQRLLDQLSQNKYREQILKVRKRAVEIGVDSTPTVLVNGHFVGSRSLKCMKSYIDRAKAGTLASSASK